MNHALRLSAALAVEKAERAQAGLLDGILGGRVLAGQPAAQGWYAASRCLSTSRSNRAVIASSANRSSSPI